MKKVLEIKRIGFWNDDNNNYPMYPNPKDLVCSVNYANVADYIDKNMMFGLSYMGYSECRICGKENGCSEKYDQNFLCPSGYSHYIRDHNVKPDLDLIEFVINFNYKNIK